MSFTIFKCDYLLAEKGDVYVDEFNLNSQHKSELHN